MDFNNYLAEKKQVVEERLQYLFSEISLDIPDKLSEAMRYSLFAGGKRLRPILVYAAAEAFGGNLEDALTVGAAIEFIHTYSLIHDDLPAMDDDDYRRGKPTNHKVFGDAYAVLSGDALLTEAFNILTQKRFFVSVELNVQLDIVNYIAKASGASGMVAGQVYDMLSENVEVDSLLLQKIHINKTAKLLTASLYSGVRLATSDISSLNAIEKFGKTMGLCFQIVDDILDVTGDFKYLGKSPGSDEKKRKATYPLLYGIEKSKLMAEQLMRESIGYIEFLKERGSVLKSLAKFIIARVY